MEVFQRNFVLDGGAASQKVASAASASAQSTVLLAAVAAGVINGYPAELDVLLTADGPGFVRQGVNPTAVVTGVDTYLAAGVPYRTTVYPGNKIAFAAVGTSNLFITPLG